MLRLLQILLMGINHRVSRAFFFVSLFIMMLRKNLTYNIIASLHTDEEFLENLGTAAQSLQSALPKVIDYVCDKKHDEL